MKIRFLYFDECPNAEPTLTILKDVIAAEAPDADLECLAVKSADEAASSGFLGSPTIQINGLDIETERRADPPYFGCRMYPGSGGIPPRSMIIEAVREAKAGDPEKQTIPPF